MIKRTFNVLIVDDHPIVINAVKIALLDVSSQNKSTKFNISFALNCETAFSKIGDFKDDNPLDLVILDISVTPSEKFKILSGEDLALNIKHRFKGSKIIVMSSYKDNHLICNIFKTINPDAFLMKCDINNHDLVRAIREVLNDTPFYSKTITKLVRSQMSCEIVLDKIDREILFHLSHGAKMKDLPKVVNLSLAGIERRKRHLRDIFDTPKKDDKALIDCAKEKGFI